MLAALAPVLLFPTPARLLLLALVPIVWFVAWRATGRAVPRTPLNVGLWMLLLTVAVSAGATFDIRFSLGKISGVLLAALVFWATARWVTTPGRLVTGLAAYLLAGGALAVLGLLGINWIDKFSVFGRIIERLPKAIRGAPGAEEGFQPNAVAGCLVLFIPLQIALVASSGRWLRPWVAQRWCRIGTWVQGALLALTLGTLLLTQSRGAWIGLSVAGVAFLALYNRWTRQVAALVCVGVVVVAAYVGPARLANLAVNNGGSGMPGDVSSRVELWSRAVAGIRDFPLTGMGMNAFRKVMPVLYPTVFTGATDFDIAHAHNHLLQAALDVGLPGLVAYLSIWMVTAVLLVRVCRRSRERIYRDAAGGLGLGLLAHFVFSMTDAIALGAKVGILFWLAIALAVSLHQVALPATSLRD